MILLYDLTCEIVSKEKNKKGRREYDMDKRQKKRNKSHGLKRILAVGLSFSMLFTTAAPAMASGGPDDRMIDGTDVTQEELKAALAQEQDLYPEGGIEFFQSQISTVEGEKKQLVIVRRGSTAQQTTVDFKALDVSATYGEDYLLTVKDGFTKKTLDGIGRPLTDANTAGMEVQEETETESVTAVPEETEAAESTEGTEQNQVQAVSAKGRSALQVAKDKYLGTRTSNLDWQEMDEAKKLEEQKQQEAYNAAYDDFAGSVEGASYSFTFQPGEYMKTIDIETLDDTLSESDEQVVFLLSNVSGGTLAGTSTAYLNISDNDEEEKAIFAMDAKEITVDRSEGTATILINRVSGNNKIASVIVGTGSDSAVSGTDYEPVSKEIVFAQGVTFQKVEIPLKNYEGAPEEASFQIALDAESSFVEEDCAITTIHLTNQHPIEASKDTEVSEAAKVDAGENQKQSKAVAWSDVKRISASAQVSGAQNRSSGRRNVVTGLKLGTADYIEVEWRSDEGSYTYQYTTGKKCKKKTHTATATDRETYLILNGQRVATRKDRFGTATARINLGGSQKKENSTLQLEVKTTGENRNATAYVSKVTIHYPGYQFTIVNNDYENNGYSNCYTEKIYTDDQGAIAYGNAPYKYKPGNKIKLAEATIGANGKGEFSDSVTLHRYGDSLQVQHSYSQNKTSNNVRVQTGAGGNVYLAGYMLERPKSRTWTYIKAEELEGLSENFLNKYKNHMYNGNIFKLHPIYRPYEARVMFQNAEPEKGSYANGFTTNVILRCTTLDTIKVRGVANKGYAIGGFNLGSYSDSSVHGGGVSSAAVAEGANRYYSQDDKTVQKDVLAKANSSYQKVRISNAQVNSALPNVVTFTPVGEFTYINPVYTVPSVTVKIDPKNNDKNKGAVIYTAEEGEKSLKGDYEHPMVIQGVTLNQTYTLNAVTEDGYKAYFKNFTGDADGNGVLSTTEEAAVSKYRFVRTASNGNAYTFAPVYEMSLIYYGFNKAVANRYAGLIDGVVLLEDKPVFGNETTRTAINGAQVSVAGQTATTSIDAQFGGVDGKGGDGYFAISSKDFTAGENQTVNIRYNNVNMTATQAVNAAGIYVLDAYDTIGISDAAVYRMDGESAVRISANNISNGDTNYRFVIQAYSKNDAVAAKKAIFRFYRKDGSEISAAEQTVESENQNFILDFNPKTLSIPTGASMTVQFVDQKGVAYYKHEMGFYFAQSLGVLSFLSSFNFGGAEKAIELIGTIDSAFNFGWDGNIDNIAASSEDGSVKTISLGFAFNKEKDLTDEDNKKKDEKAKQDVKDAARGEGSSRADKDKRKDAADKAVDKNDKANKQKTDVAASAYIEMSFALQIDIAKATDENHKGEWYFQDMILAAQAAGGVDVLVQYMTPIGVPIRVGIKAGASGSATFVIEQTLDKKEYYLSDVMDKDAAKIDLFSFNMKNADRAFDAYGAFNISPYLDLSAGAGFDFLNLMVGGRADFDMNFYTRADQTNNGNVTFSAYIELKILFFKKKWNLASTNVNLFGGSDKKTRSLNDLAGNADYRYESLAQMEDDPQEYLKARSGWLGESDKKTRSIESSGQFTETTLLEGMSPDSDVQMMALPDGKYLMVFLVDSGEGSVRNSKQLYYSIGNGTTWSRPSLVEDDGTTDSNPVLYDLGDAGIFIAWSSADRKFTEDDSVIDTLNAMNIHGRFFDKTAHTMGEIQEITKTAPYAYTETEDGVDYVFADRTADVDPHISCNDDHTKMLVFYTKTEYESSAQDDQGLVGDVANSYSVMAYREYDMTTGTWNESYKGTDYETDQDYTKAWYGQKFLALVPEWTVKETLDEDGYWAEGTTPEYVKYEYKKYEQEDGTFVTQEPIVIESDAISYNDLALYAYVLDHDGNKETDNDRDVYLYVYDYKKNAFVYPIIVTSTSGVGESKVHFERSGDTTLLTYLSGNTLYAQDVRMLVNCIVKSSSTHGDMYYIQKARPNGGETDESQVYMPPIAIAGDALSPVSGGSDAAEQEETEDTQNAKITDYYTTSNGQYIYAFWIQEASKVKKGIDPESEAALLTENRVAEAQIYGVRYDVENSVLTEPVQITEKEGANYKDFACAAVLRDENTDEVQPAVKMTVTKAMSTTETITGTDQDGKEVSKEVLTADMNHLALEALEFVPAGNLVEKSTQIGEVQAGSKTIADIELYNDGMETLDGLKVTAEDEDGNVIHTETMPENEKLFGGGTYHVSFELPVKEDATDAYFKYHVTGKSGNKILEGSCRKEIPLQLDVDAFKATTEERGIIRFAVDVTNNSGRNSGVQKINLSSQTANGERVALTQLNTENLKPGESGHYTLEYPYDYDKVFEAVEDEKGNLVAQTTFRAELAAGNGTYGEDEITLSASKEQKLRMDAVQKLTFVDGKNSEVTDSYVLPENWKMQLQIAAESKVYTGSRYEENADAQVYDKNNTDGLSVRYVSDNEEVLKIYENGIMEPVKKGTANITAYITPAANEVVYSEDTGAVTKDNYATLPEETILKKTVKITVGAQKAEESETPDTKPDETKKPNETEKPKETEKPADNGVKIGQTHKVGKNTYKVTRTGVTLTKAAAKRKVTVPATVKIKGKTYKVTAISKQAFKGAKSKLTQVTIGKNVRVIEQKAFYGCKKLKKITIQSKVLNKVGKNAIGRIYRKAVIKVPKSKVNAYKKKFTKKTGFQKSMKLTK